MMHAGVLFNLCGGVVFAVWLVLTVFNQFQNKWIIPFQRWDAGHLLPRWTFFAPTPGTSDYHLVFRDLDGAGQTLTSWEEIPMPPRPPMAAVWNPQKRARKVVTDMTQALVRFAAENPKAAPFCIPYLALLQRAVEHCPPAPGAWSRQFALVQTQGPDAEAEPKMLYRSNAHPFVTPDQSSQQAGEAVETSARSHWSGAGEPA